MEVSYTFFKEYPATRIFISKLMQSSFPTVNSSYKVKKMVDELSCEFELYKTLLQEKESIIQWDKENNKIVNQDEVNEAFKDLYTHTFKIEFGPLAKEEIECLSGFSPKELELLEMLSEPNAFDYLTS